MKDIGRREFLRGLGIISGASVGAKLFNPYWVYAAGATLTYGISSRDIRRLDPMSGPNSADKTVLAPIFSGLVRTQPGEVNAERIEGDLAESWESSKDLKIWTFKLRQGVEFHQGFGGMAAPCKEMERLYFECKLKHGNNPALNWMANNCAWRINEYGQKRLDREQSSEKIDGMVALVMAIGAWLNHGDQDGESVYVRENRSIEIF